MRGEQDEGRKERRGRVCRLGWRLEGRRYVVVSPLSNSHPVDPPSFIESPQLGTDGEVQRVQAGCRVRTAMRAGGPSGILRLRFDSENEDGRKTYMGRERT